MITKDTIDKVISRLDIIEVVGDFVKLKKRGSNYIGLCPFHNEKSPSFSVSPSKEIYKCFGCGKSGNTISFLMEHEKISYTEAIRWLGKKYNVEIEETQTDPEYRDVFGRDFFANQLWETEMGRTVGLGYLTERGFSEETIRLFQLGYAPNEKDTLTRAAIEKKYNVEYLQRSGLITERNETYFDNYRDRIVFPIHSPIGRRHPNTLIPLKTNCM
jgi:DNA primase